MKMGESILKKVLFISSITLSVSYLISCKDARVEEKGLNNIQEEKGLNNAQEQKGLNNIQEEKGLNNVQEEKGLNNTQVEKGLKVVAEAINKQTPIKLNEAIRLDGAEVDGKKFIYKYTIIDMKKAAAPSEIKENLIKELKSNPQMKPMAENDVELVYIYKKPDGSEYCTFSFQASEYK